MDKLKAIATFMRVAELGSLSAAARTLGQPLTTVSRHLAHLEEELGVSLIVRTTRRLAVTDAGRSYLQFCRRLLEDIDSAEASLTDTGAEPAGELVITAPIVFGRLYVLPVLVTFIERHPRISARVQLTDQVIDLTDEGVDIAIRIGAMPSSSLVATKVGTLRRLTCAAPSYLRTKGVPARPEHLADHTCIVFAPMPHGGRWTFKHSIKGTRHIRPHVRLSVNTAEAAIDAAAAGLGITRVMSYQAEAALAKKQLKVILEAFDDGIIPVQVVHRSVRLQRPHVRLFLDLIARELKARLIKLNKTK